jgi:hypothetical protein
MSLTGESNSGYADLIAPVWWVSPRCRQRQGHPTPVVRRLAMAVLVWQTVAVANCGRGKPAELQEERLYPTDLLDEVAGTFQVRARRCEQADACREAGYACRWTGLNPNFDPFEL